MEFKQEKEIYNLDNQTTIEFLDKPQLFNKTTTVIIDRDRFLFCKQMFLENGEKYSMNFGFMDGLSGSGSSFEND